MLNGYPPEYAELKYLGIGFYKNPQTKQWTPRPHETSVAKFQRTLKKLCKPFVEHINGQPYH